MISVIIPLYNKEAHIKATLDSVLGQSFKDFEVIIVNDGSTDDSLNVIKSIEDIRIQIFTIENQGVSHARNFGIEKAKAELVAFLDADDIWCPEHLNDLITLYEAFPNCGLYCKAYIKKENKHYIPSYFNDIPKTKNWKGIVSDYFEASLISGLAWTSAVMVPKKNLKEVGNFDEKITMGAGEDTDLWIRIAIKYPVAFYNKISVEYNLHTDNRISKSNTNLRQFINLNQYETLAKNNTSLKKYLDINRYSIAIQYKLVENIEIANSYINEIDFKNLNWKQRYLIKQKPALLKMMLKIKNKLTYYSINLTSFK